MPPAVRIESRAWDDPRFAVMGRILGVDRDLALVKFARVWGHQTERFRLEAPIYEISAQLVDAIAGVDGFAAAAVTADLAEQLPDGRIRPRGTAGEIEWLAKKRIAAEKGGAANKARLEAMRLANGEPIGSPPATHQASQTEAKAEPNRSPLSLSPSLAPTQAQADPEIPPDPPGTGGGLFGENSRPVRTRRRTKPSDPTPEQLAIVERVISRLNERSGRAFEASAKPTQRLIVRLLRDGYSEEDLRLVVWDRASEWAHDDEKAQWLRPTTLFGPEKFPDRVAEARAAWSKFQREKGLEEHQRLKSLPPSPLVASLLGDAALRPRREHDVRVGRVEPLDADAYNRAAADGGEF
jgi:uncharacterized phage protein (TIGR02220 family)